MIDPKSYDVPVKKGDPYLTPAQFDRKMQRRLNGIISALDRAKLVGLDIEQYSLITGVLYGLEYQSAVHNDFNKAREEYHAALARLSEMQLSKGQPERFEDQETGQFDSEGQPIIASVLVQKYIAPLDATVEEPRFDEDTGEALDPETVPNPAIVKDNAERAAAQALIDGTPQAVKDWA